MIASVDAGTVVLGSLLAAVLGAWAVLEIMAWLERRRERDDLDDDD